MVWMSSITIRSFSNVSFLSQDIVSKHTIATHLLDAGADLALVKDWLRHANIQNITISAQLMTPTLESMTRKVFAHYQVVESAIVVDKFSNKFVTVLWLLHNTLQRYLLISIEKGGKYLPMIPCERSIDARK
jgi:hypothetical protein